MEAKLVPKASRAWPAMSRALKIPYEECGALMIARNEADMFMLRKYMANSLKVGVTDCELLSGPQARKLAPRAFEGENVVGGLHIPREAVTDPFQTCLAYAESAMNSNTCEFVFNARVDLVNKVGNEFVVKSGTREWHTKTVINSAGLGARVVADLYQGAGFKLNPRRGQFLVYDSMSRPLCDKILLPVPGPFGKGILITPTVFGNLLAGPTAEDLDYEDLDIATTTTAEGLELVKQSVLKTLPGLKDFKPIAHYAGARSNCDLGQFIIRYNDGNLGPGIVTLAGVRSTGLSASAALADEVFEGMEQRGLVSASQTFFCNGRPAYPAWYRKKIHFQEVSGEKARTICFCENVNDSDIREVFDSKLTPMTTDSIKRRTRAMTGRCQGFNCLVDVCKIVAEETKRDVSAVSKKGLGTEWFPGFVKNVEMVSMAVTENNQAAVSSSQAGSNTDYDVIVVGAGPAGLGAVEGLNAINKSLRIGVLERSHCVGGVPARYAKKDSHKKTFVHWQKACMVSGYEFAQELSAVSEKIIAGNDNIDLHFNSHVQRINRESNEYYDVVLDSGKSFRSKTVVFATGARESTSVERGWVTGHRGSKIVFSNHLLVSGGPDALRANNVVFSGAGLVARSIGSLATKSFTVPPRFAESRGDEAPLLARMYFGGGPTEYVRNNELKVYAPNGPVESVAFGPERARERCDALVLSGCLVPNDEALKRSGVSESRDGVFVCGNVRGASTPGASWPGVACYLHAKYIVAQKVARRW